jgi:outer membrane protein assembly factor BamB
MTWSEDRNVDWKVALPGRGHGSPVVWGDRIFITTAIPIGDATTQEHVHADGAHDNVPPSRSLRYVVLAIDRRTGATLWSTPVHEGRPHESTHQSGSWASASAATDGKHLIAFFGSAGLYGLTTGGELLWSKRLGLMRVKHGHGEGSSPALHGRYVVVNWDHEGESFIAAFDKQDGTELWRMPRDEATSWSSPLIVEHAGRVQVVVAATRRVRGYDLGSGKLLWECGGLSGNVVATPVAANGLVHVASSYEKRAMLTIRLDRAKGDITGTDAVVWARDRDTPYVPSLLLAGGELCFLKHYQGILTCVDAATGAPRSGPHRLPAIGNVYASPVASAGRIYVTDQEGTTLVLRREGEGLEVLARNILDDRFAASAAIDGDGLILRGERHLYRLAERESGPR